MYNKIVAVIFCGLLALSIVVGIAVPDSDYSENEKRLLVQLPEISFESFFSGDLEDSTENYLADQFPARNGWIAVKTVTERITGKKEESGVIFAKDGYLIDKFDEYDSKQYEANLRAVKKLSDRLKEQYDIGSSLMLIPTAAEILDNRLPAGLPEKSQKKMIEYAKSMGIDTVDLTDTLKKHNNEYIYYMTDHHYTSLGAYYCYSGWKKSRGELPKPLSAWKETTLSDNFRGTTYSKVNYPLAPYDTITGCYMNTKHKVSYNDGDCITDTIYEKKYLKSQDKYGVFFNSNQATTVISGDGEKNLLLIKDSFANTFAQFVIDEYNATHMIDMRFYRGSITDYIAKNNIDEVLVLYSVPSFAEDEYIQYCMD